MLLDYSTLTPFKEVEIEVEVGGPRVRSIYPD